MGLKRCRECGAEVSTQAKACPKCGRPNPVTNPARVLGAVLTIGIGTMIVVGIASNGDHGSSSDAAVNNPVDSRFVAAAGAVIRLKDSMRNPQSFQLSEVMAVPDEIECLTFRAQNGFGGFDAGFAVVRHGKLTPQESAGFRAQWSRFCENKTGYIITAQVQQLVDSSNP